MRLARADSETMRPCQTAASRSSFGDDSFAVSHQMNKKVENLGLDSHKRTFPAQFPPIRVEYAVRETIAQEKIPLVTRRKCNTQSPKEK
jgi:hypothetical protein